MPWVNHTTKLGIALVVAGAVMFWIIPQPLLDPPMSPNTYTGLLTYTVPIFVSWTGLVIAGVGWRVGGQSPDRVPVDRTHADERLLELTCGACQR